MLAKRASGQEKQRRILDIMLAKQAAGQEQQRRKPDIMLAECAAGQETTNTHTQTSHYAGEMRRDKKRRVKIAIFLSFDDRISFRS